MWTVTAILTGVSLDSLPLDPGLAGILRAMGPDPRAVHTAVAPRVGSPVVDRIAGADYGHRRDEYREAVNDLLARADPPRRLDWMPVEVLSLSFGSSGSAVDLYLGSLLLAAATPDQDPLDRLPTFLRAALDLGGTELVAARRFLAWCRLECPGDWPLCAVDLPYLTFGVLLLSVMLSQPPPDETLCGLAAGLVDELDRSVVDGEGFGPTKPPLIEPHARKPRGVWRDLAGRVLVDGPLAGTGVGARLAVLGRVIRREEALPVEELYRVFR